MVNLLNQVSYYIEKMLDPKDIFPIGIGTWGLGGFSERNPDNDDRKQIAAVAHMFDKGMNYVEVNLWAAEGHSARIAAAGLQASSQSRDSIFISQAVYDFSCPDLQHAEAEIDSALKLFNADYIDSFEFNNPGFRVYGADETIAFMHKVLASGKTRYVAIASPNLNNLEIMQKEFGNKFFSAEVGFNFEVRENVDTGVIPFLLKNRIKPVIYQPLRRNRTAKRNWPLLVELAGKYGKTQNQIILNWIVSLEYLPLFKSDSMTHIDENLAALDFKIEQDDLQRLTDFRPPNYESPHIVYYRGEEGVLVDQLSNVFDERYDEQLKSDD